MERDGYHKLVGDAAWVYTETQAKVNIYRMHATLPIHSAVLQAARKSFDL
jgi:hypothetical protein